MGKTINIAIDGPSGAGKSTTARKIAEQLGFLYVDTGALYRSIGYFVLQQGKNPSERNDVVPLLDGLSVSFDYVGGEQRVYVNGEDVSDYIRTQPVSMAASDVSPFPEVRSFLFQTQRAIAEKENIVMDGRDVGTVILPDADLKIFLTASAEVSAKRRFLELSQKGIPCDYETILADVNQRDYNDSHRAASPLRKADDAVLFDNSAYDEETTVALITNLIKEKLTI